MGLAYYVGASEMQGLVPGLFAFYLGTDPQKIEPVKAALLDEIHKLANEGLTACRIRAGEKEIDRTTRNRQSKQRRFRLSLRARRALWTRLRLLQTTRAQCKCRYARRHQESGGEIFSRSTVRFGNGAPARKK